MFTFLLISFIAIGSSAAAPESENDLGHNFTAVYSTTNFTYPYPELEDWKPPHELQKYYPFYLTGFDDENRPIWVAEWGKFDMRRIARSAELSSLFDTYCKKAVRVISKSHDFKSTAEIPVHHANFLIDLDEMKIEQVVDPAALAYVIHLALEHRDIITEHAHRVVAINTNFVAETIVRVARSVFGGLFERVEVYGTNKAKWIPQLLRVFPRESLAEWYGGLKGHTPMMIFG